MKRANNRPVVSKRVPVLVDKNTYERFRAFSEKTGITLCHSVDEALNAWMDVVGVMRLEAFKKPGVEILRASASKS